MDSLGKQKMFDKIKDSCSPFSKGSALQQSKVVIEGSHPLKKGERGGFKFSEF